MERFLIWFRRQLEPRNRIATIVVSVVAGIALIARVYSPPFIWRLLAPEPQETVVCNEL